MACLSLDSIPIIYYLWDLRQVALFFWASVSSNRVVEEIKMLLELDAYTLEWRYLAMSGDILSCHNWESGLLTSIK